MFAGLIPWTLFSQGMAQAALSLVNQQQMLTKVYFPRLFVPVAAASVFLVDLLISLAIYAVVMLYYGVAPSWGYLWLVLLIPLTLVATLGIGLALAGLTVFYRDFKHVVPFLMQILMYVTPVIYPAKLIGMRWQLLLSLNPDVRDRHRVPLGHPRPGVEFRDPGDLLGLGRDLAPVRHVLLSQDRAPISRTSPDRDTEQCTEAPLRMEMSSTDHEPAHHRLRSHQQILQSGC